ncbi:MAG: class I SAM-dependent methyltransferase [Chloroflexi bacterium]|nr:class I SAM-dependent methyltransferase [Chloroflexota bacterium]
MDFSTLYWALSGSGPAYRSVVARAFGATEAIGQHGLTTRRNALQLSRQLGLGQGDRLLDVCCGPGGPGRAIGRAFGCHVFGVDYAEPAVRLARLSSDAQFSPMVAHALQLPFGRSSFQAALVLDSMAAFSSPSALFRELARVLIPGGRLGITAEVGRPLGRAELMRMPPGPAYVFPEHRLRGALERSELRTLMTADCTRSAASVALRFVHGLTEAQDAVSKEIGRTAVLDLTASLTTWGRLLQSQRVRELMIVAERR